MDDFSLELRIMLIVCILAVSLSHYKHIHPEPKCIQAGPQQNDIRSGRTRF